jgi:LmbE family N-acetylglucosaminyl deacetylase
VEAPATASPAPSQTDPFFSAQDRVLVIAPHPDDETLGAGGAIQAARAAGAKVRVVYVTHGDHNEIASLFYLKKLLVRRADFIKSGKIRKKEALAATAVLGLGPDDLVFLGYPDSGLQRIWRKHWGAAKPFRSFLTRISRVPYEDDFSYGKDYTADNVVEDFRKVLSDFRPTKIFVTPPFDLNADHQAAYLFLRLALQDLRDSLPRPEVRLYLVHAQNWPLPKKYDPAARLDPPAALPGGEEAVWESRPLTPARTAKKARAISKYESQTAYAKNFLLSFARREELFARPPAENLTSAPPAPRPGRAEVEYGEEGDSLKITVRLLEPLDEVGTLNLDVFPYNPGVPFGDMPKYHLRFFGRKLFVSDSARRRAVEGVVYRVDGNRLTVLLPGELLGEPEILFVSAETSKEELSLEIGSWKVLRRDGAPAPVLI